MCACLCTCRICLGDRPHVQQLQQLQLTPSNHDRVSRAGSLPGLTTRGRSFSRTPFPPPGGGGEEEGSNASTSTPRRLPKPGDKACVVDCRLC